MNIELIIIKWRFAVWTSPLETCRRVVFKFARGHHWKSLSMVKLSCRLVSLYILPYCIHRRKITLLSCHWHSPRRVFNSFFFFFFRYELEQERIHPLTQSYSLNAWTYFWYDCFRRPLEHKFVGSLALHICSSHEILAAYDRIYSLWISVGLHRFHPLELSVKNR